jgi:hypothetical protein
MENLKDNAQPASDYRGKWIQAIVTGNTDSLNAGRIQISVPGVVEDNPWAIADSVDGGGGGGDCTQDIPAIGSKVYVKFQDGKINFPVYRGAVIQPGTYLSPLTGDPNIYGWVRGTTSWWLNKTTGEFEQTGANYTHHVDGSGNETVTASGSLSTTYTEVTNNVPNTTFTGNVTINGNLLVQGAITVNGGFTSNGGTGGGSNVAVFNGPITTTNNLSVGGTLAVTGTGSFGGDVSAPNIS